MHSDNLFNLRQKIKEIQFELNELGNPAIEIPEMITSSNLSANAVLQ